MVRNGDEISIGELTTTDNTCAEPEDIMDQEARYLAALQNAVQIRESARSLEFYDADKPILLFYAE